jgi:hypothetical protein
VARRVGEQLADLPGEALLGCASWPKERRALLLAERGRLLIGKGEAAPRASPASNTSCVYVAIEAKDS